MVGEEEERKEKERKSQKQVGVKEVRKVTLPFCHPDSPRIYLHDLVDLSFSEDPPPRLFPAELLC